MANNKQITERERAAALYAVAYGVRDKTKLYRIAYDGTLEAVSAINNADEVARKWWKSQKMTTAAAEAEITYERKVAAIKAEAVEEYKRTEKTEDGKLVDYSNPKNRTRRINEILNKTEDTKDALDAIKLLDAQQKGSITEDREVKQVKSYIPVTCKLCPIKALAAWLSVNPDIERTISERAALEGKSIIQEYDEDTAAAFRRDIITAAETDALEAAAGSFTREDRKKLSSMLASLAAFIEDAGERAETDEAAPVAGRFRTVAAYMAR